MHLVQSLNNRDEAPESCILGLLFNMSCFTINHTLSITVSGLRRGPPLPQLLHRQQERLLMPHGIMTSLPLCSAPGAHSRDAQDWVPVHEAGHERARANACSLAPTSAFIASASLPRAWVHSPACFQEPLCSLTSCWTRPCSASLLQASLLPPSCRQPLLQIARRLSLLLCVA
jgi:hypothetical protein